MNIKRDTDASSIRCVEAISNSDTVVFCFAGIGYTIVSPMLYYVKNLAEQYKIDFIGYDCDYVNNAKFNNLDDEQQSAYFEKDIDLIIKDINKRNYPNRIIVGKSLGTTIMNRMIEKNEINEQDQLAFLTPYTEWNIITNNLNRINNKSLIIGGLSDDYFTCYDYSVLRNKNNISIIEYEGCDHVLETGDCIQDLSVLMDYVKNMEKFIDFN